MAEPHAIPMVPDERPRRFFAFVLGARGPLTAAAVLVTLLFASFIPDLERDTSAEAFIPHGHPALERRALVREVFGLSDPIVVALVAEPGESVFRPDGLQFIAEFTTLLEETEGLDSSRITSLTTENDIIGTREGLEIRPFFETTPASRAEAEAVREAVLDFPLYEGSLVATDGSAVLFVAEVEQDVEPGEIYRRVHALARAQALPHGLTLHVAGEAGITGFLGQYIEADSKRMIPLAFVLIVVVLSRAYRTVRSVALPLAVVASGVIVAIGGMAAAGTPYTLISSALPVVLVAIGVADGIHILAQYYHELERDGRASQRELVIRSMIEMWKPITITSITDVVGFLAIAASTAIPPLRSFGLFAALGILALWAFSLLVLPGLLSLLPRRAPIRLYEARMTRPNARRLRYSIDTRISDGLARLGAGVARNPRLTLATVLLLAGLGAVGASSIEVDHERIRYFQPNEAIAIADRVINERLDGTSYLDVMIVGAGADALLAPALLQGIQSFQRAIESLPHVEGTTSIVDYLTRMNRSLHADRVDADELPTTRSAVSQLLLLHSMQSEPDALEHVIDFERQRSLVRVHLDSGRYSHEVGIFDEAKRHLDELARATGADYRLAGRVAVDVEWMSDIGRGHVRSVVLSMLGILLTSVLLFRSFVAGLLTTAPVAMAVLALYGVMSACGLWLGVTTSMFAAMTIGLGVDFSVHLIDRLRRGNEEGEFADLEGQFARLYTETGRTLLFNFACVVLGLSILTVSQVPVIVEFGLLMATAVSGAFLAAITVIPALAAIHRPAFLALAPSPDEVGVTSTAVETLGRPVPLAVDPTRRGWLTLPFTRERVRQREARPEPTAAADPGGVR